MNPKIEIEIDTNKVNKFTLSNKRLNVWFKTGTFQSADISSVVLYTKNPPTKYSGGSVRLQSEKYNLVVYIPPKHDSACSEFFNNMFNEVPPTELVLTEAKK